MLLKRFRYYHSVTGDEGRLFSLSFEFCPTLRDGGEPARKQLKELLRKDFSSIKELLDDALLNDDKKHGFEKLTTSKDSAVIATAGFQYAAKNFTAGRATVAYRLGKMDRQAMDRQATVSLKLQLGHHVDLKILDKVMALPDLHIGDNIWGNIQKMKETLADREQKQSDPTRFLENAKI